MVVIFTDCGIGTGNGHLSRCILLYDELTRRNQDVIFCLNEEPPKSIINGRKYIVNNWWDYENFAKLKIEFNFAIIDSYKASIKTLRNIKLRAKSLCINDLDEQNCLADLILAPTMIKPKKNYIIGSEFCLVRPEFFLNSHITRNKIESIFISLGTDVNNKLNKLLEIICKIDNKVKINVVTANHYDNMQIKSYYNLSGAEMSKLMDSSDVAIISAGQTLLETLALKIPFVAIKTVDNHQRNYNFIKENNLISYDLDIRNNDFEKLFTEVYDSEIKTNKILNQYKNLNFKLNKDAAKQIINLLLEK